MQLPTAILDPAADRAARALACELAGAGRAVAWFALALDRAERIADAALCAKLSDAAEAAVRERAAPRAIWRRGARLAWCAAAPDAKAALATARAVVESVRALRVEHDGARHSATASIGVAVSRPGLSFESLVLVAEEGLAVARAGGGDRAAHTELYAIVHKRAGGEPLPEPGAARPAARPAAVPQATRDASVPVERVPRPVEPAEAASSPRPVDLGREDETRIASTTAHGPRPIPRAAEVASSAPDDRDARIEILERRIAKLVLALAQAESRLSSLEREHGREGVASIYREVQGLDPRAPAFDTKRRIMARIFEANLALQAKYAS